MLQCPQCTKPLRELTRRCPSCQADLDLLVDYVSHLQGGLERAENLVRAGELGQAVWAYLEVLETDPDNTTARRQVSQVVTAVRQFDQAAPGRRWYNRIRGQEAEDPRAWVWKSVLALLGVGLLLFTFTLGYWMGAGATRPEAADRDQIGPPPNNDNTLGGGKR